MKPEMTDWARLAETLEELRSELKKLGERVAALETAAVMQPSAAAYAPGRAQPPAVEMAAQPAGLDEELLLVISAAIAAFLGKKPHIRQIQLLGHAAWVQQGRVTIQASHRLSVPHH
jgi:methylmalonyl-CoA carboxyltransferase large subunit